MHTLLLLAGASLIEIYTLSLHDALPICNLPFSADETQVRQLFEQHGTVESVALINDRETGRPRGFGFVEMPRPDAQRAIQSLNGKDMGGRPLRVNEAQERQGGGGGGGGGRGPRGGGGGGGGGGRW